LDDGTITYGTGCTGPEVGQLNAMLVSTYGNIENSPFTNLDFSYTDPASTRHWLGSFGPAGRHWYMWGNEGNLEGNLGFCGTGRCQPALVWLVHDGDIGVAIDESLCIDTDGDGWGWDVVQSCRLKPVETECVDTEPLNDGWGWNGITSCQTDTPAQAGECIDTDPVGDGWGWDGVTSCQITTNACIDTVPLNDGWGWDGSQSCRTEQPAQAGECIDTDPAGDGWGWNGVESCMLTAGTTTIYDPVLKKTIELQRLQWQASDVVEKSISCAHYTMDDDLQHWIKSDTSNPYFSADGSWTDDGGETTAWSIENGQLIQNSSGSYYPYARGAESMFLPYALVQSEETVFYNENPKDNQRIYFTPGLHQNTRFDKTVCNVVPQAM
jgi:hypothetical protein